MFISKKNSISISILPFLVVGLLFGATLGTLYAKNVDSSFPYYFISLYGLIYLLAIQYTRAFVKLCFSTLIVSFIATIPLLQTTLHHLSFFSVLLAAISAYAINAFHLHYQKNGWHLSYETLFDTVWNTVIQLCVALFFSLICWIILKLCGTLFDLVHISFINKLLEKISFNIACIAVFMSLGLFISLKTVSITQHIRAIVLLIFRYLLIPLSIITILFFLALLTNLLFNRGYSFDFSSLLPFSFLTVLFINAYYQNGKNDHTPSSFFLSLYSALLSLAPIFTLLAFFILLFQSLAFGFILDNYYRLLFALILLAYNLCYIVALFQKQKVWLKSIEKFNVILGVLLITIAFIAINPVTIAILPQVKQVKITPEKPPTLQTQLEKSRQHFISSGFQWKTYLSNTLPKGALILGYNPNPLYFCRTKIKGVYYGGVRDANRCEFMIQNQIQKTATFEVLCGQPGVSTWQNNAYHYDLKAAILIDDTTLSRICRTIINNRIVLGVGDSTDQCTFIADHQAVSAQQRSQAVEILLS